MLNSHFVFSVVKQFFAFRLGDGAILQNLYPSHSHVKLRNGTIERIDTYYRRMIDNRELLREVTMIKSYEYNQWARTRGLNEKDYESSKPIPLDKIESKSIQPSWNTVRPMNSSLVNLGAKNRIFSYEDLASKFNQPKFLKRMGFIDNETDYNSRKTTADDENEEPARPRTDGSNTSVLSTSNSKEPMEITHDTSIAASEPSEGVDESEELSSDDEEYHNNQEDDSLLNIPPERVPSSKRSTRQKLALYKDDLVIGSKSSVKRVSALSADKPELLKNENDRTTIAVSTVEFVDDLINKNKGVVESRHNGFQSRPIRRESVKLDIPAKLHRVEKDFVRFSQPVCLCPKLSKETLNSLYSPTMQKYLSNHANGFMRCQLHGNPRHPRIRDKIVLKSL